MRDIGRRFRHGGKERSGDEYDREQRSLQHAMIKSLMSAFLTDGPDDAESTFVFAHGAGGAMDTPFMTNVARGLAKRGIRVVRFEFPYMAARREGKKSGAPDRQPVLLDAWRDVVAKLGGGARVASGGKTLRGRDTRRRARALRLP